MAAKDGLADGVTVGSADGITVGHVTGIKVGPPGATGALVGDGVGTAEGGRDEGRGVGTTDGAPL